MPQSEYKEQLPLECPPETAQRVSRMEVVRALQTGTPTQDDFRSHAALGKINKVGCSPCRWASCSVFVAPNKLEKLPKIRKLVYFAHLEIDQTSGVVQFGNGGHIDLWMFSGFDPLAAVTKVVRRPS